VATDGQRLSGIDAARATDDTRRARHDANRATDDGRRPADDARLATDDWRLTTVFVRHVRARRYVLRVLADGRVSVTLPRWGSKREAAAFAESQHAWIARQRRRVEAERARPRPEPLPPGEVKQLRDQASRDLPRRLADLAARFGLTVSRVSIRNQRWRWGSCSRRGHICLNWRLVLMPAWVSDYVIIHELMHLRRLDHSPRFWKLVAAACPRYLDARRWLNEHGETLRA
jgi:predicted metal-dependent hydrolase